MTCNYVSRGLIICNSNYEICVGMSVSLKYYM